MDVKIIPVKQAHITPIMELNRECMPENYDVVTHLAHVNLYGDINFTAVDMSKKDKEGQPIVVGYVMARVKDGDESDRGHITSIAVHPAYRRQKIAKKLMIYAQMGMTKRKLTSCTLECRHDNEIAVAMYKSLGYNVESIRKNYYSEEDADPEDESKRTIDGFYMLKEFNTVKKETN